MKAALRLAIFAIGFLTAATTANAQFDKLQPASYGVWSPQVGAGAIYRLESEGKQQILELAIVRTETHQINSFTKTGYWIEMRVREHSKELLTKHLSAKSGSDLLTVHFESPPSLEQGIYTLLDLASGDLNWMRQDPWERHPVDKTPLDFRRQATRIATESTSTPAGTFDCEVWRTNNGGVTVWYSPKISPFGVVKLQSKAGSVLMIKLIDDAKEQITLVSEMTVLTPAGQSEVLYRAFPGVWAPVVGSGASYQLERNGKKYDVELAVVATEKIGSDTYIQLEVYAPCIGRSSIHFPSDKPEYSYQPFYNPPDYESNYGPPVQQGTPYDAEVHWNGSCTNRFLTTSTGFVESINEAVFKTPGMSAFGGAFTIPEMMQLNFEAKNSRGGFRTVWLRSIQYATFPPAVSQPQTGDLPDIRRRAVLIGTETIRTPAGVFQCEHWREAAKETDVWLNPQAGPFGLVKRVNADGVLMLTKITANAVPRATGKKNSNMIDVLGLRTRK